MAVHTSGMFVKSILSSTSALSGINLHTLHLRFPRFLLPEFNTHRVFSRNARSSRAVPVKTMLDEIRNHPVIPWHWSKNQPGMQGMPNWTRKLLMKGSLAAGLIDPEIMVTNEAAWLYGRDLMADLAESFMDADYHKQIANRLIEPFSWIDVLVSSTDWSNFLHLRDHPDAEPHIHDLAVLVRECLENEVNPQILQPGEWHTPYISREDIEWAQKIMAEPEMAGKYIDLIAPLSAARNARISYTPFDGNANRDRELERYHDLIGGDAVHASPLEHIATPDVWNEEYGGWDEPHLHGNFRGFIQFRKTIPNEAIFG